MEGNYADILVFDPETFQDHATFQDPARLADGLGYLFVNGALVIQDDQWLNHICSGRNILAGGTGLCLEIRLRTLHSAEGGIGDASGGDPPFGR